MLAARCCNPLYVREMVFPREAIAGKLPAKLVEHVLHGA